MRGRTKRTATKSRFFAFTVGLGSSDIDAILRLMGHAVFLHRSDSIYDDSPAERYQFPSQYKARVDASIGDWIVYLEPSKVPNTRGYFGMARVSRVVPDRTAPGMFVAEIDSYLPFAQPVPFRDEASVLERGLLNERGVLSGRAQSAVRPLSEDDFQRIVSRGLEDHEPILPRVDDALPRQEIDDRAQSPFIFETERVRVEQLTSRLLRDRVFRQVVLKAYDRRCVVTGLQLINGGGRAEVAAAHIRPVEKNGPDIVNNGIALSGTAHWMFDRGLISIADDMSILISRQANDRASIENLINSTGHALPPTRPLDAPHPAFLKWHRENCFKH